MKLSIFLTLVLIIFSSCGDLKDHGHAKVELVNSQLNPNCKIDEKKLALILSENVVEDIDCVEKTLNVFIKLVKSGKPGHLSKDELDIFLKKYFTEKHEVISSWLSILFKFNYLLIDSSSQRYIHQDKLKIFFNFFYFINKNAATVFSSIRSDHLSSINFKTYMKVDRVNLGRFLETLKDYLEEVYRNPIETEQMIDLSVVLDSMKDNNNQGGIEKVKSFLFIKRLLLGGQSLKFSHGDLGTFIQKLPQIGLMLFDAIAFVHLRFEDEISRYKLAENLVYNFKASIHYATLDRTELFSLEDALKALSSIDKFKNKILEYKDAILATKKVFSGNNKESFTSLDLTNLTSHILKLTEKAEHYYRFYNRFKDILNDPQNLVFNPGNRGYGYQNTERTHFKDFTDIINRYRLYKGNRQSPVFSLESNRNFSGLMEHVILEYVGTQFYRVYGTPDHKALNGYRLEYEGILKIMQDYSSYLLTNKIITDGRQQNTAETIILNSNLFNLTGNGGLTIELDEFVPFAVNVLSSLKISQSALDHFNLRCGNNPDTNEITNACYKQHFYEAYFNDSTLKPFVPRMVSEIETYNKQDSLQFIDEVQHFSRLCPYPDSLVTKGDIMAAVMGIYSIENAMIMFEKNNDNMLNRDEVMDAYNFFEDALKRLLKTSDNGKQNIAQRLSRAIFYYLVDYNKTPESAGDLMKVLAYQLRLKRPDGADRVSIAAILKTISTTSTTNRLNPGFCPRPGHLNAVKFIQDKFDVKGTRFATHLTDQMKVPQRLNATVIASFVSKFGVEDAIDILEIFVMYNSFTKFEMSMILLDLTDYHKETIGKKALKKIKKWAKQQTFINL